MELISVEQRRSLNAECRDLLKIELRDDYGMDAALLTAWRAGDREAVDQSAKDYAGDVAARVASGRSFRRLRVVSEPLSEYQEMAVATCSPSVDAGEDLRWLPRRLVSAIPLPGNDAFVLDGGMVIFNVLDGNNRLAEIWQSTDPDVVAFCRDSIESAWAIATPHHEYKPA